MGEERVKLPKGNRELQQFVKDLITDIQTLELMLEADVFDTETIRIGAEQEMCLVDSNFKPAMINLDVLAKTKNDLFTTELAKFNLETNVEPLVFKGNCLSVLEKRLTSLCNDLRKTANKFNSEIILTGILPTIRKFDLEIENLTPIPRYFSLVTALKKLRGKTTEINIKGDIDELMLKHDSPLLEGCNTGYQVHLQIKPNEFAARYNIAQAIAGPAMAAGTNSPLLFGKRLWAETRVALFQQSIDTRTSGEHLRDLSPRVMFGNRWLQNSIIEIYKEDISRFRVLLSSTEKENSMQQWEKGITPNLRALQIHNGTVYRWNRPCYGVKDNVPHLRIENRVLPAGPTVIDEIANTALWLGLMNGVGDVYKDITSLMDFEDAKSNFFAACRKGLDNKFSWVKGKKYNASDLIVKELIPIAKDGLKKAKVLKKDADKYLGLLEDRVKSGQTGSTWMLNSYAKLSKETTKDDTLTEITASIVYNQKSEKPIHKWPLAKLGEFDHWEPDSILVEEFMTTDLFTCQKDDIIELVAEMIDFRRLRYVPVENDKGKLVGLITSRGILKWFSRNHSKKSKAPATVKQVMIKDPFTISPDESITKALEVMEKETIGCLPVVKNDQLVGVVTEQDFRQITARLIKRFKIKKQNRKNK